MPKQVPLPALLGWVRASVLYCGCKPTWRRAVLPVPVRWLRERQSALLPERWEEYASILWENRQKRISFTCGWVRSPCAVIQGKHPTAARYATSFSFFWVLPEWERVEKVSWVLETCLWVLWKGNQMDGLLSACFLECTQLKSKTSTYLWERSVCLKYL